MDADRARALAEALHHGQRERGREQELLAEGLSLDDLRALRLLTRGNDSPSDELGLEILRGPNARS